MGVPVWRYRVGLPMCWLYEWPVRPPHFDFLDDFVEHEFVAVIDPGLLQFAINVFRSCAR